MKLNLKIYRSKTLDSPYLEILNLRGWLEDGTNYYSLRRFGKINVVKRMARSAGVKRNWSVLYVSYLQAIEGEGKGKVRRLRPVYKRYVVYRCRTAWEDQGERSEDR